jgi:hypothetical protein
LKRSAQETDDQRVIIKMMKDFEKRLWLPHPPSLINWINSAQLIQD